MLQRGTHQVARTSQAALSAIVIERLISNRLQDIVTAAADGNSGVGTDKFFGSDPRIFAGSSHRTPDQCGFDTALPLINLRFSVWDNSSTLRDDFLTKRVDRSGRPPL
jgi:hypothetical protein